MTLSQNFLACSGESHFEFHKYRSTTLTMVTAKLEIAAGATHSKETLASILTDYFDSKLVEHKILFGGYSGTNYMVKLSDGSQYVLKVTNGYSIDEAELMCKTAYHLVTNNFKDCCWAVEKKTDSQEKYRFVSLKEPNGVPAFMLTFSIGKQADKVMREQPKLASAVMKNIGGGLGRMHLAAAGISNSKQATDLGLRWYQISGGCCDVSDHVSGKILHRIKRCPVPERKESYLSFYEPELKVLVQEMSLATGGKLQHGITHGDPFADNILVNEETGALSAFIDIEDICVGPLLFDLACCAIGCCFHQAKEGSNYPQVLDMELFQALIQGYNSERRLPDLEMEHLVPFMRLALLCNCSWRFVKFNVPNHDGTSDFPDEAKLSYLELQHRIEYLNDQATLKMINEQLAHLK